MTLDEFIQNWGKWPNNAWVEYPGLDLYVRRGKILIRDLDSSYFCECLTIASVEAHVKGQGSFTGLIEYLKTKSFGIYVENVHNARLRNKLIELGFKEVNVNHGPNYAFNC